jgi:DNA-binding MarR family transcriptional regulator
MAGMLVTSILSGQLISRTGRYKIFPIIGTLVMAIGLYLMSRMTAETTTQTAAMIMLLLGLGLGMVMQVLVIAVQNDVEYRDLGVATSGATLFRLVGGSLGTAVLGAVFSASLARALARVLPGSARVSGHGALNPETLRQLSPALRDIYIHAFTVALGTIFVAAAGVALLGCLLTFLMPEHPLRQTVAAASGVELGEAFAMPEDPEPEGLVLRGLATLADRDVQRDHIQQITTRAGVDLAPLAASLLVRIDRYPETDVESLGKERGAGPEEVRIAVADLRSRGLIQEISGKGRAARWGLTATGCDTLNKLAVARRAHLAELFSDWGPSRREELATVLRRLADELVPEVRSRVPA